jgi:hypothetical protein
MGIPPRARSGSEKRAWSLRRRSQRTSVQIRQAPSHQLRESDSLPLPQKETPEPARSRGVSPERTGGALEKVQRGSARGHDRGRRRRGVRLPRPRTSNAGDTPGMRLRAASQPKRGRLQFGRRSLDAAPRPIDAFSFRSPRPLPLVSPPDRLGDRESEPPSELRIPRRRATSPPVRAGPTQRETSRSPGCDFNGKS